MLQFHFPLDSSYNGQEQLFTDASNINASQKSKNENWEPTFGEAVVRIDASVVDIEYVNPFVVHEIPFMTVALVANNKPS